jgi:hypothetical protein
VVVVFVVPDYAAEKAFWRWWMKNKPIEPKIQRIFFRLGKSGQWSMLP